MYGFFGNGSTAIDLRAGIEAIKKYEAETNVDFEKEKSRHCINIISEMLNDRGYWDKHSPFNIKEVGNDLILKLRSFKPDNYDVDYVFSMLFRFLMEVHFNRKEALSENIMKAKTFAINRKESFNDFAQHQISYAIHEMPFSIIRLHFQGEDIQLFIEAAKSEKSINETMAAREGRIKSQLKTMEELKATLEKQTTAFNFVGLYFGFDDLSNKKKIESRNSLFFTLALGVLVLLPFGIDALLVYKGVINFDSILSLFSVIPLLTLTFIFIYYFRVSLSNYTSIKAQVDQIELRKTLCQFIQKYSEYAKEMKANDGNSLDKFESIIFSNIMPSEDKIPSTFDGIEQIAKLIESIKK
ncbi:hypothetical protein ABRP91_19170 [Pectobacterium brasiliense]|uniref:hypothetical protein n=1 Tax=Pectobacterium brasiliense TaxID=180957 RepID=UPI0032EC8962